MRNKMLQKVLSLVLVACMVAAWALPSVASAAGISFEKVSNDRVSANLFDRDAAENISNEPTYAADEVVRVSIVLEKAGTLDAGFSPDGIAENDEAMAYRAELGKIQADMTEKIGDVIGEELDVEWNITLAANLISANVPYGKIAKIESLKGVKSVVLENQYVVDVVEKDGSDPNMSTSSSQIGSSPAWAAGLSGAGSRIAIIDTGLDMAHQSFDPNAYLYSLSVNAEKAGMDLATYIEKLDLLDAAEILAALPYTNLGIAYAEAGYDLSIYGELIASLMSGNEKVPFAFNYVDMNNNVSHLYDTQGEHGSHVAGIAGANAYIPSGDGYISALDNIYMQGVAPDAQILVMKVFGEGGGAFAADYMAALEDAIVLGADSINLSLGSGAPGMSTSGEQAFEEILNNLEKSGVVVTISAGNSYYWSYAVENTDEMPGDLYLDDISQQTSGSPGTFINSLGVASVDNIGSTNPCLYINGQTIWYAESAQYGNKPMTTLGGKHEYVFLNNIGTVEQFQALGVDLTGKIAICYRGESSFYEKANAAVSLGAAGVIIVNNQPGIIYLNLTGYQYTAPVVSITQAEGEYFKQTAITGDGVDGWTGTVEFSKTAIPSLSDSEYYTMSIFSSWGVPSSLTLKPEITAPGGDIYSVGGAYYDGEKYVYSDHASYENMSGTSMAAPQMAGIAALMAQFIRENGLDKKTGLDARTLSQSLLMSTAVPVLDGTNYGYYYPVMRQGAGLVNVGKAIVADSYILMGKDATASYADGKVKAELGDDPDRTGKYSFSFTINNLTDEEKVYALYSDIFTQGAYMDSNGTLYMSIETMPLYHTATWTVDGKIVDSGSNMIGMDFNGDGYVNSKDGQALLDYATGVLDSLSNADLADLNADGKINSYDSYLFFTMLGQNGATVPANGSVTVQVTIELDAEDKAFLDTYYENGAYIEGYVYAESMTTAEGVEGTSHSIPVLGYYGNWSDPSMYDKGSYEEYMLSGEEYRAPYLYETNMQNGLVNALFMSSKGSSSVYYFGGNPVTDDAEYAPERNAISLANGDYISSIGFTSIRNAGAYVFYIKDNATGEYLVWEATASLLTSAYYYVNGGAWRNTWYELGLSDDILDEIAENTNIEMGLMLIPEYYLDAEGNFDAEALGHGVELSMEMTIDNTAPVINDISLGFMSRELVLNVTDNQYVAGIMLLDEYGMYIHAYRGSDLSANAGDTLDYTLDLSTVNGNNFLVVVVDYAGNMSTYELRAAIGETTEEISQILISDSSLVLQKGRTAELQAMVLPMNAVDRSFTWSSADESIATVDKNGVVTAVDVGITNIIVTSHADPSVTAVCKVEVINIASNLNAVIWDENGDIYYSEFNSANLPNYNKLSGDLLEAENGDYITSVAVSDDGTIYASSLNTSTGTGNLYTVDPETYELTFLNKCAVGSTAVFYSDLTYVPNMFGTGVLLAGYGRNVLVINPATGTCLGVIDKVDGMIVGIAASGMGVYYPSNGVYQDIVFITLADGTVILENYYGYSGMVVPYYNYFYGTRITMDTGVDKGDAFYFNSTYFDGSYLFWSAFDRDNDNSVSLYAIDVMDTEKTYYLGDFADSVWPVGGLHQAPEAAEPGTDDGQGLNEHLTDAVLEIGSGTLSTDIQKLDINKKSNNEVPAMPFSVTTVGEAEKTVSMDITAMNAEGVEIDSTNGVVTVTYDADALILKSVIVHGDYTSMKKSNGTVTIGYVSLEGIEASEVIATLLFDVKSTEVEQIEINHKEVNDLEPGHSEYVAINYPHANTELRNYKAPTCTDEGYTGDLYCLDCGILLQKGEVSPATDHSFGEWTESKPASCTEPGEEKRVCTSDGCEHYETREIPATDHSFGEWTESKPASCTEPGEEKRVCTNDGCEHYETRETALAEHSYKDTVTAPTTTSEGYTTHTCEHCGHSYNDTFTDKLPIDPDNSGTGEDLLTRLCITTLVISMAAVTVLFVYRKKIAQA